MPPKESRFPNGNKQNRLGRPKGARNQKTILREIVDEKVSVRKDGKRVRVSIIDLLISIVKRGAVDGDQRCQSLLSDLEKQYGQGSERTYGIILLPSDPPFDEFVEMLKDAETDRPPCADDPLCDNY
ncbi:MAG: hypothetical protein JJ878_14540 [Alphaproteobacteria bacterium]|nr:hypothetical protein [Alphaproteobacteria bacterium]MBO6863854.1 hypothetical protein [Alphaproteobacteria bacterium]MEC9266733.1 DUF5681 domain-containing protein [Pseudomonadota bacterium]